ncbi:hypothetical protein [Bacteriovorax sp. Seq25_V]|uniref:hypothetical protein n=1 Tax=Bacteriovorax sp. Seq25_V TaxID=1201288 RepID=UPI00038A2AF4|nr:hypothetical protein [Bacteriovorax sp. Seq25_V]EQC47284.1 hypothetical protein M900_0933 [Bacteriovorax sp. Seq25_V]
MKLCKFLFISIIGLATLAENIDLNSLTIRTSVDQSKTYKIKKITISRPGANESKEITIETYGSEKCVIPIDQIIKTPRPSYQGCTHCLKDDVEVEDYYVQLFLNSINPSISCDVKDGVTTGFNFAGGTTINGKSSFSMVGLIFNMAVYTDGEFESKPYEKDSVDKFLDDAADILLRMAF